MNKRLAQQLLQLEHRLRQLFVALAVLATIAGVLIVALVGASVTMRYIAQVPFRFTEELVGLLMTAAFFLALPLVTLNAEHVRVQILVASLPPRLARWVSVTAAVFGFSFSVWFCWLCLPWFEFAYVRSIKTEVGRLLMYPWMFVLPMSMLLTSIAFALKAASGFQAATPSSTSTAP